MNGCQIFVKEKGKRIISLTEISQSVIGKNYLKWYNLCWSFYNWTGRGNGIIRSRWKRITKEQGYI